MKVIIGSSLGTITGLLTVLLSAISGGSPGELTVPLFGIFGALTGLAYEIRGAADRVILAVHDYDQDLEEENTIQ
ncbi:MAG: hypothetical protein M3Q24_00585 [bacterium]|nr:hypothetical protein [bacterium]